MHDPVARKAAVFIPSQYSETTPLPIVYYLPGFGGSSEGFIKDQQKWLKFTQQLADTGTPVLLVVSDARTRWGGSQYLNSPAQGNYADYICDEIVPLVESRYHIVLGLTNRVIAGHSSGGFGALRLGSMRPKLFGSVIALSPDSDFEVTHRSLMMVPAVTNVSLVDVKNFMGPIIEGTLPKNGDLRYALALSAAYAPRGRLHPGEFEWLFSAKGEFSEKVWHLWLDNDPLTIVQKSKHAFHDYQSVYLEGASKDAFKANIGAHAIYDVLKERPGHCTFYEPPGTHSSHVPERLQRGLAWCFGQPLVDIK